MLKISSLPGQIAKQFCRTFSISACLSGKDTFKYDELQVQYNYRRKGLPNPEGLLFGQSMTDHMFEVHWREDRGWSKPVITDYHPLQLDPAAKCLHYALQIFEGMKAYRGDDDKVRLFRPDQNFQRMNDSAKRLCLPQFDGDEMTKCLHKLVDIERDWVFKKDGFSLYIRPTMIGSENSIGVAKASEAILYIICCPVGPYFPHGMKPVSLLADPAFVRAWPGGGGDSKLGSNYGPTIMVQEKAAAVKCQQVLWLFGEDHQITEAGTMNVFVRLINEKGVDELVTPPLTSGVILPGVVRRSALDLARSWKTIQVSERPINMNEIVKAKEDGRLLEMFGSGTACVVCPVERLLYGGKDVLIDTESAPNSVYQRLYKELNDIYYGRTVYNNWCQIVEEQ